MVVVVGCRVVPVAVLVVPPVHRTIPVGDGEQ